jgi:hypothetical protein
LSLPAVDKGGDVVCSVQYARAVARMRTSAMARIANVVSQKCRGKRTVKSNDQDNIGAPALVSRNDTRELLTPREESATMCSFDSAVLIVRCEFVANRR